MESSFANAEHLNSYAASDRKGPKLTIPIQSILYLVALAAALGFALGMVGFLVSALCGRRDRRRRRLSLALSSGALLFASLLSAASLMYLELVPLFMRVSRPDFQAPYLGCSRLLSAAIPSVLLAFALLVSRAILHTPSAWKRAGLTSLACVALVVPMFALGYVLAYHVQAPAYELFVRVEGRDWKTHVGDAAPDVSVVMLDGSTRRLSEFRGKPVLLNFFATWCGPCNAELPHLEQLWRDLRANDGVVVLVISRGEARETVAEFMTARGFTFPVALDPSAQAFKEFADESIPRTYLIGRDGTIRFQSLGFAEGQPLYQRELATLRQTIDRELAANP